MNKYKHLAPPPPKIPSLVSQHKNKVKHRTLDEARDAAAKMSRKENGAAMNCYRCAVCGFYHVGHAI